MAVNTPVQGSAADLIKKAMLTVDRRLREEYPGQLMLLQVHDELLLEVDEELADEIGEMVRHEMCSAMKLSVPLVVDLGTGRTGKRRTRENSEFGIRNCHRNSHHWKRPSANGKTGVSAEVPGIAGSSSDGHCVPGILSGSACGYEPRAAEVPFSTLLDHADLDVGRILSGQQCRRVAPLGKRVRIRVPAGGHRPIALDAVHRWA